MRKLALLPSSACLWRRSHHPVLYTPQKVSSGHCLGVQVVYFPKKHYIHLGWYDASLATLYLTSVRYALAQACRTLEHLHCAERQDQYSFPKMMRPLCEIRICYFAVPDSMRQYPTLLVQAAYSSTRHIFKSTVEPP